MEHLIRPSVADMPPYVPGKRPDQITVDPGITEIVKMSSNECAFGVSPAAAQALRNAADRLFLYPASGDRMLCEKVGSILDIDPDRIIMGNGSDAVIYNLGMTILEPGDEVIIPEITFLIYRTIANIMNARIAVIPMNNMRINTEAMLEAITPRTKMIFLCNPNNPTGDTLDPAEVRRFLAAVPDRVLVVLDEAYIEFVDEESDPDALGLLRSGMENLFILRTLSKSCGIAGIRLGYGIGDPNLIAAMNRVKQPFEVSLAAQEVGMAALEDRDFFHKVIDSTRAEMAYFREQLDRLGLRYVDSQANFFLIDTGMDADAVFGELQRKGFIVRPGSIFGLSAHIRVTIGTREQNRRFFQALEKIIAPVPSHSAKEGHST
ncbi:MAG: histidinol-phosphate transaminase [Sediminispirochaetaceae bacterium]